MNVLEIERPVGVVCQFGGQTAIKLAKAVREAGYSILGTDLGDIDAAEDRELFNELLTRLGIPQPKGTTVFTADEAAEAAAELGYPVLLGTSRKSMIGLTLDLPADQRVEGTVATSVIGVMKGCAFVRVHDVKENVRAIRMTEAILHA